MLTARARRARQRSRAAAGATPLVAEGAKARTRFRWATQGGTGWKPGSIEIADGIYRLSTFVPEIAPPAGFTFNQFLVVGDEPLLFHTGLRAMFPLVSEAVARIMPVERLRWITFGHVEADECGAMNEWLAAAPQAPGRARRDRLHGVARTTWPTARRGRWPTAR